LYESLQSLQARGSDELSRESDQTNQLIRSYNGTWDGIDAEAVARMRLQNRFRTGLDIARYTGRDHAQGHGGL
jgi:hypothetical protein